VIAGTSGATVVVCQVRVMQLFLVTAAISCELLVCTYNLWRNTCHSGKLFFGGTIDLERLEFLR
jgi:hypothetical protein